MKKKVLIVEDERDIANLIVNRLDEAVYEIFVAYDGSEALALIQQYYFDLVSLDIMLPGVDGMVLCQRIRERHKDTLIMMVSALEGDEQKTKAYRMGADDYVSKPFSPKVLALKISVLLQRRFEIQHAALPSVKAVQHDEEGKKFYVNNAELILTTSEYMIFSLLFRLPKKVFLREELSQVIYDNDIGQIDSRGIDTHIYQLRKKIKALGEAAIIKTVRGIGYSIEN